MIRFNLVFWSWDQINCFRVDNYDGDYIRVTVKVIYIIDRYTSGILRVYEACMSHRSILFNVMTEANNSPKYCNYRLDIEDTGFEILCFYLYKKLEKMNIQ